MKTKDTVTVEQISLEEYYRKQQAYVLEQQFSRDRRHADQAQVDEHKVAIIQYMVRARGAVNMDELYDKLELFDITMYLALHELVQEGRVLGHSIYDPAFDPADGGMVFHTHYEYCLPMYKPFAAAEKGCWSCLSSCQWCGGQV